MRQFWMDLGVFYCCCCVGGVIHFVGCGVVSIFGIRASVEDIIVLLMSNNHIYTGILMSNKTILHRLAIVDSVVLH